MQQRTNYAECIFKRELSLASASSSLYFSFSHLSFCHFIRPKTKILFSKHGPANKSCSNISNLLQLFWRENSNSFLSRFFFGITHLQKFKSIKSFKGANIQIVQIHWSYFLVRKFKYFKSIEAILGAKIQLFVAAALCTCFQSFNLNLMRVFSNWNQLWYLIFKFVH